MTSSELYLLLNILGLAVGALALWPFVDFSSINLGFIFFIVFNAIVAVVLMMFSDAYPVLNNVMLLMSLYIVFKKDFFIEARNSSRISSVNFCFFLSLLVVVFALSNFRGWQSVMSTSVKYWILFNVFFFWRLTTSTRNKILLVSGLLILGLIWKSKITLLAAIILIISKLMRSDSFKQDLKVVSAGILTLVFCFWLMRNQIADFAYSSVFRPDYSNDTKILGLSDGSRLNVWADYLTNARLYGKGDFAGDDFVPTHNIFVYFVHEFGYLSLAVYGPLFLFLLYRVAKNFSVELAALIFFSFTLSSLFEYSSGWVMCIIIIPLLFKVRFRIS